MGSRAEPARALEDREEDPRAAAPKSPPMMMMRAATTTTTTTATTAIRRTTPAHAETRATETTKTETDARTTTKTTKTTTRTTSTSATARTSADLDTQQQGGAATKLRIVNPERLAEEEEEEEEEGRDLARQDSFPVPMFSPRVGDAASMMSPRPAGLGSPRFTTHGSGSVSLIFTGSAERPAASRREAAAAKRAANAKNPPPKACSLVQRRTALHEAILASDEEAFDRLLVDLAIEDIDACEPETGYSALMSAAACEDGNDAVRLVAKLIERGAETRTVDAEGFSALHWAAAMGNCAAMEALLDAGVDIDGASESGDTPLHRAARFGREACITCLVRDYGADVNARNEDEETALDAAGFLSRNKQIASKVRAVARKALFEADNRMKTLVLMHDECLGHRTAQAHQEAPERIVVIHGKLQTGIEPECLQFSSAFEPATKALLRYAHNDKYIDLVFDLHSKVASLGRPVPFTPRVQVMNGLNESQLKDERGCDTFFSEGSLPAARRAVGAVCCAVDNVVTGRSRNAFCLVRPPGHHAGVNGLLDNAVSCGFCIFNNVAIGAMHALTRHKDTIRRIAIVDFDVHHGNGTEEIVRTKFKRPKDILFFSVHLYDKAEDKAVGSGEFYPGSGGKDDPHCNIINSPIMPLWRVPTNRTRSKKRRISEPGSGAFATAAASASSEVGAGGGGSGPDASNAGNASSGTDSGSGRDAEIDGESFAVPPVPSGPNYGRQAFRDHVRSRLVPALYRFDPDLIFISAGFDAGKNDVGCSRTDKGKYWSGIDLGPDDYAYATGEIQQVARSCCNGRVISLLEGGYGQWAREKTGAPGEPKKLVLNRDQLGENALAHVRALVDR